MTELNHQALLEHYAERLQQLSADNLEPMLELLADNVEFRDPFNHTHSRDQYRDVMVDMFASLDNVQFDVTQIDATPQGGYLTWVFSGYSAITKQIRAEGVSQIRVHADGKIDRHIDYWDGSEIMQGVPLLGWIVRTVKRRASAN